MNDGMYDDRIKALAAAAKDLVRVDHADCVHELDNFLCGDRVTLDIARDGGTVSAVGGRVRGCLLVQAAAALIARDAPGKSDDELKAASAQIENLLAWGGSDGPWADAAAFTPVHNHRHRHDCVLLPFQALKACLKETEGG
ncbi:MAG: iron-sulfur cluster assembly scaffold protein [Rhodospirillaceae bacterium]